MGSCFNHEFSVGDIVIGKDHISIFIGMILSITETEYELHTIFDTNPALDHEGTLTLPFNHQLHYPLRRVTPEQLELFRLLYK